MAFRLLIRQISGAARVSVDARSRILGSDPSCEIHVDHPSVSKQHARLWMTEDGSLSIEDLGSSNGTYVDGRRIQGEQAVGPDHRLAFGNVYAQLEQVCDGDALAAFSLGEPTGVEPQSTSATASVATSRVTLASNVLEAFTLQSLPEILSAIENDLGVQVVAERLGSAFWTALPTAEVEIRGLNADEMPLFEAGEPSPEQGARQVVVAEQDDHFALRVVFRSRGVAQTFGAVAKLGLQLLSLARSRRPPSGRAQGFLRQPPLPDPPTVTARVREIYERATRIAGSQVNVLVLGESGTGKEVLSRFIHRAGTHHGAPFVALNCAALPKELLEAELFGIEKGVATGVEARAGKFEAAHRGTLFLDEVGDMALETQAKILRVLEERTVYRLGGKQAFPVDIQVVSATNRDLNGMLEKGTFRADLFYRLAGWEIQLPPLRHRRGDISNLAVHFFKQEAERLGLHKIGISVSAMDALKRWSWPGNIRELHHEIARGVLLLSEGDLLETRHLRRALLEGTLDRGLTLEAALERTERQRIEEAFEEGGGVLEEVLAILGISRSTLYRRMRALGIERD